MLPCELSKSIFKYGKFDWVAYLQMYNKCIGIVRSLLYLQQL